MLFFIMFVVSLANLSFESFGCPKATSIVDAHIGASCVFYPYPFSPFIDLFSVASWKSLIAMFKNWFGLLYRLFG